MLHKASSIVPSVPSMLKVTTELFLNVSALFQQVNSSTGLAKQVKDISISISMSTFLYRDHCSDKFDVREKHRKVSAFENRIRD